MAIVLFDTCSNATWAEVVLHSYAATYKNTNVIYKLCQIGAETLNETDGMEESRLAFSATGRKSKDAIDDSATQIMPLCVCVPNAPLCGVLISAVREVNVVSAGSNPSEDALCTSAPSLFQTSSFQSMPVAHSDSYPTLYVVHGRAKPVLCWPNSREPNLFHNGETTYRVG